MPLKTGTLEEPRLDLTPMLDCVMLLIIFFMVGTQFTTPERQYDVQLPTVSDAAALTAPPDELIINILSNGTLVVRGESLTLPKLEALLAESKANFPNQAVSIRGDGTVKYQNVMDALSACRRVGIRAISLANRPTDESP